MRRMIHRTMLTLPVVAGLVLGGPAFAAAVEEGQKVFTRWCVHCHAAGRGNPGTESLQVKYKGQLPALLLDRTDLSPQAVALFVRQGALSMAPFRKTEITDAELAWLSAYVAGKYTKP